jgi:epoxyqueuosine reductase
MTTAEREDRCEKPLPGNAPPPWDFLGEIARRLGFAAAGVAPAGAVPPAAAIAYDSWLARGLHADLAFAARGREPRRDPRHEGIVGGATAVVCVALPYGSGATDAGLWRHVAAHARGRDYHATIRSRLTALASEIAARFPGARHRSFADTAPLPERTWAVIAGIGSIGANGALFVPGTGPRVVLGEIVLSSVPVPDVRGEPLEPDPCRRCGACAAACPTGALLEGGLVDCRSCVSYHTIENPRGEVPPAVRSSVRLVFGCDACTAACPRANAVEPACALEPPPRTGPDGVDLARIAEMPDAALAPIIGGTCLERTGAAAIRRNARFAIGARGDVSAP